MVVVVVVVSKLCGAYFITRKVYLKITELLTFENREYTWR